VAPPAVTPWQPRQSSALPCSESGTTLFCSAPEHRLRRSRAAVEGRDVKQAEPTLCGRSGRRTTRRKADITNLAPQHATCPMCLANNGRRWPDMRLTAHRARVAPTRPAPMYALPHRQPFALEHGAVDLASGQLHRQAVQGRDSWRVLLGDATADVALLVRVPRVGVQRRRGAPVRAPRRCRERAWSLRLRCRPQAPQVAQLSGTRQAPPRSSACPRTVAAAIA
jgi:hypothetical protein